MLSYLHPNLRKSVLEQEIQDIKSDMFIASGLRSHGGWTRYIPGMKTGQTFIDLLTSKIYEPNYEGNPAWHDILFIYTQSILVFDTMQVLYWPVLGQIQFCNFDRRCKTCLDTKRFCNLPHPNRLCACSKTGFVPTLNQPLQNRLCACSKTGFVPTLNQPLQKRFCACSKTGFVPTLNQPAPKPALCLLQNQLCAVPKPAAPKPALCLRSTCRTKTGFASALNLPFHFE